VSDQALFSREQILAGGVSRVRRAPALLHLVEHDPDRFATKPPSIAAAWRRGTGPSLADPAGSLP
jgi:hypothetical protein